MECKFGWSNIFYTCIFVHFEPKIFSTESCIYSKIWLYNTYTRMQYATLNENISPTVNQNTSSWLVILKNDFFFTLTLMFVIWLITVRVEKVKSTKEYISGVFQDAHNFMVLVLESFDVVINWNIGKRSVSVWTGKSVINESFAYNSFPRISSIIKFRYKHTTRPVMTAYNLLKFVFHL